MKKLVLLVLLIVCSSCGDDGGNTSTSSTPAPSPVPTISINPVGNFSITQVNSIGTPNVKNIISSLDQIKLTWTASENASNYSASILDMAGTVVCSPVPSTTTSVIFPSCSQLVDGTIYQAEVQSANGSLINIATPFSFKVDLTGSTAFDFQTSYEWLLSMQKGDGGYSLNSSNVGDPTEYDLGGLIGLGLINSYAFMNQNYVQSFLYSDISLISKTVSYVETVSSDPLSHFGSTSNLQLDGTDALFIHKFSSVTVPGDSAYTNFAHFNFLLPLDYDNYAPGFEPAVGYPGFGPETLTMYYDNTEDGTINYRNIPLGWFDSNPTNAKPLFEESMFALGTVLNEAALENYQTSVNNTDDVLSSYQLAESSYSTLGIAMAILDSVITGIDLNITAGPYSVYGNTAALADHLASLQVSDSSLPTFGGFMKTSNCIPTAGNSSCVDTSITSYATLALATFNRGKYLTNIQNAVSYYGKMRLSSGIILNPAASSGNSGSYNGNGKVTAEALAVLSTLADFSSINSSLNF
jgi:hypothetical protein